MFNRGHFWRNVALIGLAHVVALIGLIRWNASANSPKPEPVMWVSGDSVDGGGSSARSAATAVAPSPVAVEPTATPFEISDEAPPILASTKSEIELPAATPTATATPAIKPAATPLFKTAPKPSPRPPRKPRPKPSPRPIPKPTPKPQPKKTLLAKASPRPSPAESDKEEDQEETAATPSTTSTEKIRATNDEIEQPGAATATNTSDSAGAGNGHGKGLAKTSELSAYSRMLHDRLYSEWDQPTTTVSSAAKISTLVRVRIEKDGRISHFEIVKPSGNVMIDESVEAIGKQVTQVDPLPPTLRRSGHYDVKINFELNSE